MRALRARALKIRAQIARREGEKMSENSSADQQILAILAKLQSSLGEDLAKLEADEIDAVRAILKHGETLVNIAKYEEAKGLFWAHWRGVILAAGAVLSALLLFWSSFERLIKSVAKGLQ
jgi:type II secretory pathway component PulL